MSSLEALQAQVAASNSVIDSAVQLINGLQARLQSAIEAAKAGDDHVALDALSADLAQHAAALGSAVAANTVVAPSPAAEPAPTEPAPAPVEEPTATPAPTEAPVAATPDATPAPTSAPVDTTVQPEAGGAATAG